jgi:hypothetical protein
MQIFTSYEKYLESSQTIGVVQSDKKIDILTKDEWKYIYIKNIYIYYKHPKICDVTFVIQGLSKEETFIKFICNLLRFGYVELATWEFYNLNEVLDYINKNKIQNGQNIYLQVFTSLSGLKNCKTKYSIKVRGDEWYEDFSKFIILMKKYPDKITTHNMFFRKIGQYPYHISDHVIGGTTENLLKMFSMCKEMLDTKQKLPNIPRVLNHCPEQWLTTAYMRCFYTNDELSDYVEIKEKMIKYFQVLPMNVFKDFILRYQSKNKRHIINGFSDLKNHSHAFAITHILKL